MMALAGGIILYIQNPGMFLISLISVVLYGIIVVTFHKQYKKLNQKQMEDNAQLTSYLVESLNGIQTIKAYNAERKANLETEGKFVRLLRSVFQLSLASNLQTSLKFAIELIGGIVILWVGAISVINGDMTMGQLITFNSLLVYFLDPVKNLINLQPQMQTATVAAERLGEILDLEAEKDERELKKMEPARFFGDITFRNVTFAYGTRKPVLENINLKIKRGEKIAFVGESGSGKTTLAKLLLFLYQPQEGDILIDDNHTKDIKIELLRSKIAYIPQETFLFSGSIMDNLMLGAEGESVDDVVEAAKIAQAHEFINEMPLRYETRLEENGTNLSGGQRQRLSIARAMLKKPDILILDEATSNLDAITERALDETIHQYCQGITTIFIAHRLSTIKNCDRIFVMEKGQIVEFGTHEELVALGGRYANLAKQQSLDIV
jgi:ATP-binding cassette subfamily B protein